MRTHASDGVDLRALFPLTLLHLGERAPAAVTPEEFVAAVCASHARGDIPCRAARDLVHYEALAREVPAAPLLPPPALPADEARAVLSDRVRVLVYGAALPEMLDALRAGKPARPRPCRGWLVLGRDTQGALRTFLLVREEGWLMESFREPTPPSGVIEDEEDRALFARLWQNGILVRA